MRTAADQLLIINFISYFLTVIAQQTQTLTQNVTYVFDPRERPKKESENLETIVPLIPVGQFWETEQRRGTGEPVLDYDYAAFQFNPASEINPLVQFEIPRQQSTQPAAVLGNPDENIENQGPGFTAPSDPPNLSSKTERKRQPSDQRFLWKANFPDFEDDNQFVDSENAEEFLSDLKHQMDGMDREEEVLRIWVPAAACLLLFLTNVAFLLLFLRERSKRGHCLSCDFTNSS